jgi:hypothetical protein
MAKEIPRGHIGQLQSDEKEIEADHPQHVDGPTPVVNGVVIQFRGTTGRRGRIHTDSQNGDLLFLALKHGEPLSVVNGFDHQPSDPVSIQLLALPLSEIRA